MPDKPLRVLNATRSELLPRPDAPAFMQPRLRVESNPCRSCAGDCCRSFDVHLAAYEAARLASVLAIPLEGFVEAEPYTAYNDDVGVAVYHPIRLDGGDTRLVLRRENDGGCVFLWHAARRGRCGVHSLRPGLCRQYPFDVEWGDGRYRAGNDALCPTQWSADDAREADIAASLTSWQSDLQKDRAVVDTWNASERADRSLAAFGVYLVAACCADFGISQESALGRIPKPLGSRRRTESDER